MTAVLDWLVAYLFRWLPRSAPTGLFPIGDPDESSPVIVTGNFSLTIRRVRRALRGQNLWLLVANSDGINVWCAADGGIFTHNRVIDAIKVSGLGSRVEHRQVILPALSASGVDLENIREETGFHAHFGPVYARDIPAYLEGRKKKTEAMRRFDFGPRHRLDMFLPMNFPIYLLVAIVLAVFWPQYLLGYTILFWGAVAFLYVFLEVIPGKDRLGPGLRLGDPSGAGVGRSGLDPSRRPACALGLAPRDLRHLLRSRIRPGGHRFASEIGRRADDAPAAVQELRGPLQREGAREDRARPREVQWVPGLLRDLSGWGVRRAGRGQEDHLPRPARLLRLQRVRQAMPGTCALPDLGRHRASGAVHPENAILVESRPVIEAHLQPWDSTSGRAPDAFRNPASPACFALDWPLRFPAPIGRQPGRPLEALMARNDFRNGIAQHGSDDVRRAAQSLATIIPSRLGSLARVAYNYRWSWHPDGDRVFRDIDPYRWRICGRNPVRLLKEATQERLERAAAHRPLVRRVEALADDLEDELSRAPSEDGVPGDRPVAFLCSEYGVHRSLPIYSGGLGALAGDILKEASDHALPMLGIGIMYRQGYFHQRVDASGSQHEYWYETDPERRPAVKVTDDEGEPVQVRVPIWGEAVTAHVWRVEVGRVPLFLLDTSIEGNSPRQRFISWRLYEGNRQVRLAQYALLGVGGMRLLRAFGVEPYVVHLNEGHPALATLELWTTWCRKVAPSTRHGRKSAGALSSRPTRRCRRGTRPTRQTRWRPCSPTLQPTSASAGRSYWRSGACARPTRPSRRA